MKRGGLLQVLGASLSGVAIVFHICCLLTTYYSQVDMSAVYSRMKSSKAYMLKMQADAIISSGYSNPHQGFPWDADLPGSKQFDVNHINYSMNVIEYAYESTVVTVGLWKLCISTKMMNFEVCLRWGSTFTFPLTTGPPIKVTPDWTDGVQLAAIIGMLILTVGACCSFGAAYASTKLVYSPCLTFSSIVCCFAGGIVCAAGNIVFAVNYKSLVADTGQSKSEDMDLLTKAIVEEMYLSWGFTLDFMAAITAILAGIVYWVGAWFTRSDGLVLERTGWRKNRQEGQGQKRLCHQDNMEKLHKLATNFTESKD